MVHAEHDSAPAPAVELSVPVQAATGAAQGPTMLRWESVGVARSPRRSALADEPSLAGDPLDSPPLRPFPLPVLRRPEPAGGRPSAVGEAHAGGSVRRMFKVRTAAAAAAAPAAAASAAAPAAAAAAASGSPAPSEATASAAGRWLLLIEANDDFVPTPKKYFWEGAVPDGGTPAPPALWQKAEKVEAPKEAYHTFAVDAKRQTRSAVKLWAMTAEIYFARANENRSTKTSDHYNPFGRFNSSATTVAFIPADPTEAMREALRERTLRSAVTWGVPLDFSDRPLGAGGYPVSIEVECDDGTTQELICFGEDKFGATYANREAGDVRGRELPDRALATSRQAEAAQAAAQAAAQVAAAAVQQGGGKKRGKNGSKKGGGKNGGTPAAFKPAAPEVADDRESMIGQRLPEIETYTKTVNGDELDHHLIKIWSGKTREKSQVEVMGISASRAAYLAGYTGPGDWEWLHLIAHSMGGMMEGPGPQVPDNLVAGTSECNAAMIMVEDAIKDVVGRFDDLTARIAIHAQICDRTYHISDLIKYHVSFYRGGEGVDVMLFEFDPRTRQQPLVSQNLLTRIAMRHKLGSPEELQKLAGAASASAAAAPAAAAAAAAAAAPVGAAPAPAPTAVPVPAAAAPAAVPVPVPAAAAAPAAVPVPAAAAVPVRSSVRLAARRALSPAVRASASTSSVANPSAAVRRTQLAPAPSAMAARAVWPPTIRSRAVRSLAAAPSVAGASAVVRRTQLAPAPVFAATFSR